MISKRKQEVEHLSAVHKAISIASMQRLGLPHFEKKNIMQEGQCILLTEHYISAELTSIDMAKSPLRSMQILGNELLGRPDLLVVLR
jgi:hypothetical protein